MFQNRNIKFCNLKKENLLYKYGLGFSLDPYSRRVGLVEHRGILDNRNISKISLSVEVL